jgi:lysophospholipid acyltransferase (LPLAT)-like uncharacterized protein
MMKSALEHLASGIIRLLACTWRLEIVGAAHVKQLRDAGIPVVFTVWHAFLLPALWHRRGEGITLLISDHEDGGYVARAAVRWGYKVVRGSSTRGAIKGSLGLVRTLESGGDVALTPDGPTGPPRIPKPGAVALAIRGGAAIVPVGAGATSLWQLGSWDGFSIPRPFARVRIVYVEPLRLDDRSDSTEETIVGTLGERLDAAEEAATC